MASLLAIPARPAALEGVNSSEASAAGYCTLADLPDRTTWSSTCEDILADMVPEQQITHLDSKIICLGVGRDALNRFLREARPDL